MTGGADRSAAPGVSPGDAARPGASREAAATLAPERPATAVSAGAGSGRPGGEWDDLVPVGGMRRRPQAMRVFALVHLRALVKDKWRTLLGVVGVALGVTLVLAVTVLQREVGSPFDAFGPALTAAANGPVRQVTPDVQARLPVGAADDIAKIKGVEVAVPLVGDLTPLMAKPNGSDRDAGVFLIGTNCDIERFVGGFDCKKTGDTQPANGPGVPLSLARPVADALGVRLGDALQVPGGPANAAHVGWIIDPNRQLAEVNSGFVVFAPTPQLAGYLLGRPEQLTDVLTITNGSSETDAAIAKAAKSSVQVHEPEGRLPAALVSVGQALGGLSAAGLVIGVLIAVNTLLLAVEDRRPVMGTIGAIGAPGSRIFGGFMGEGTVLGVLGGAIGVPLGFLLGRALVGEFANALLAGTGAHLDAKWDPAYVGVGIGAGVLCGVLAILSPARKIAKGGPLAAMEARSGAGGRRAMRLWWALVGLGMAGFAAWLMWAFGGGKVPFQFGSAGLFWGVMGAVVITLVFAPRLARFLGCAVEKVRPAEGTLLVADLDRYPALFAGTCATLAIGAAVAIGFAGVQELGTTTTQRMMASQYDNAVLIEAQGVFDQREGVITEPVLARIRAAGNSRDVQLRHRAILPSPTEPRLVIGVEPASWYAERLVDLHGDAAEIWKRLRQGQVAVSDLAAARLGATPGSEIQLPTVDGTKTFTVAGTFSTSFPDDSNVGDWVLTSSEMAKQRWGAVASQAAVRYPTPQAAADHVANYTQLGDGLHVYDTAKWSASVGKAWERYFQPFAVTGYVIMLAAAVSVLNMFLLGQVQRRRERAVLRAIGLEVPTEQRVLLLRAGLLAICGVVFGAICAQLFTYLLTLTSRVYYGFSVPYSLAWEPLVMGSIGVVVMALAGVLLPCVQAGRLDIADKIRGE